MHVRVFDGVFVGRKNEALRFTPAQALSQDELWELVKTVAVRVPRWLRKHRFARYEQAPYSNETRVFTCDEMLAQLAAGRGTVQLEKSGHDHAQASNTETYQPPPPCDGAATFCGFNLHASVRIPADDRGRERRCRIVYPSVIVDRLRLLPDGSIGYCVKKSGRRSSRVRIMTPVQCLARLCALVPPLLYPWTRYRGVIAPRARPRKAILPQPPRNVRPSRSAKRPNAAAGESKNRDARASLSVCARQEDVLSVIAPTDARCRGEAIEEPCCVSPARALGSSNNVELTMQN